MARFLAEVEGTGQPVHRLGSPNSGIRAQAQGWNIGVKVYGQADGDDDKFYVYVTSGSNGGKSDTLVAIIRGNGSETDDITLMSQAEIREGIR